ncbi:hypothetical protein [Pseudomonas sp. fls2-241-R2A-110]|jgi:hypothetical protein|nr:hypothetical protein [Pseudomonas sp. fls2-241-R2A-110]
MNAVTHFHLSPWGDFSLLPSMTRKGQTLCMQPPEKLGADTGNPGK